LKLVEDRASLTMADQYSKSYMVYRTAAFLMTLNDPYPQYQGFAIIWHGARYRVSVQ